MSTLSVESCVADVVCHHGGVQGMNRDGYAVDPLSLLPAHDRDDTAAGETEI